MKRHNVIIFGGNARPRYSGYISRTEHFVNLPHPNITDPTFAFDITSNSSVLQANFAKKSKEMKKSTESPAKRRMIEGRRDVPLYSEDHGAEGKSSNSEEGEDGRIDAAP